MGNEGGKREMKINIGLGLYPLIFIIVFIKRYLAGVDLSDIHVWIGIAITSFFWWIGIVIAFVIGFFLLTIMFIRR